MNYLAASVGVIDPILSSILDSERKIKILNYKWRNNIFIGRRNFINF